MKKFLTPEKLHEALEKKDLTEPSTPPHAIKLMVDILLAGLEQRHWPSATLKTGPRLVTAADNYGLLGYSADEITLGSEHTRWVDEQRLLRTQTTSLIPAALQEAARLRQAGQAILLAAPGMTFRRDSRDRWHCAEPHQLDIWVLGEPTLSSREHLLRLVGDLLSTAIPGQSWTFRENAHHYTDYGIEVNVSHAEALVEVLECGQIATSLLQRLGIDPTLHGGLALGMGLDRLVMLRKGIPDIRLLRDEHPQVQAQMHDLELYTAVSRLPSISRDLSVAVLPGQSEEAVTEHMLAAAGERADWIESMQIKGRWTASELPAQAIERLGLMPGQENLLLNIILRHSSRSITRQEANSLYMDIQNALHAGRSGGGYRIEP